MINHKGIQNSFRLYTPTCLPASATEESGLPFICLRQKQTREPETRNQKLVFAQVIMNNQPFKNQTVRKRFKIGVNNSSFASKIIAETIDSD